MLLYAGALYTGLEAIAIFRDYQDNGTELLILAKPMTRIKIVLSKFFVYLIFCIFISLCSGILVIFTIFMPDMSSSDMG